MTRKTMLEMLAFGSRNDIAKKVPDGQKYAKSGVPTVTTADMAEFLHLSALGHKAFFKYSRVDRIYGMLKSRRLYLSRLSEMNDLDELVTVKDANRTYLASMSFGGMESMEMWKMYGGDENESVRFEFPGKEVRRLLDNRSPIYEVIEKDGKPTAEKGPEIPCEEIVSWSFHDVAYKYGDALMWNGRVVGKGRCAALEKRRIWDIKELDTFIKRYGWGSENEVRLVVKLKTVHSEWKRIAVEFGDAIDRMQILIGPAYSKVARAFRAFSDVGQPIPLSRIKESNYRAEI